MTGSSPLALCFAKNLANYIAYEVLLLGKRQTDDGRELLMRDYSMGLHRFSALPRKETVMYSVASDLISLSSRKGFSERKGSFAF
ncbi:MAG: hypothetical protein K2L14_01535 [Duncaniella sp.]|nr:hypothetical protein [Duncaniella sp.]